VKELSALGGLLSDEQSKELLCMAEKCKEIKRRIDDASEKWPLKPGINMQVLGLFISGLGFAAVALAFVTLIVELLAVLAVTVVSAAMLSYGFFLKPFKKRTQVILKLLYLASIHR
jgi:Flp pilus assembly protein TadB